MNMGYWRVDADRNTTKDSAIISLYFLNGAEAFLRSSQLLS
jgi:hypothetical protein